MAETHTHEHAHGHSHAHAHDHPHAHDQAGDRVSLPVALASGRTFKVRGLDCA
jgi:hypothetical protein